DRREVLVELIRMDLKPAVFGFLECEGERREFLRGAEPDEAALAHFDVGDELLGLPRPRLAVDALGDDDEIGVVELRGIVELLLKRLFDAESRGALLENVQQGAARNACEAMPAGAHG